MKELMKETNLEELSLEELTNCNGGGWYEKAVAVWSFAGARWGCGSWPKSSYTSGGSTRYGCGMWRK